MFEVDLILVDDYAGIGPDVVVADKVEVFLVESGGGQEGRSVIPA